MKQFFDSRHLGAFSVLARTGSFTRAAAEAQVTQSAISHSIRHLENQVGCRLFDRTSRQVTLTQAGEQFLVHVKRIAAEMIAARAELQNVKAWGQAELRLIAPTTLCEAILPRALHDFRQKYPHSSIKVFVADRHEALDRLRAGEADLAIALGPPPDERIGFEPLFSDELAFVAPPAHPWAKRPSLSPAEIGSQRLIAYNRQSHTWKSVSEYFAEDEISLTVGVECESIMVVKELLKLGAGVGVLAPWVIASELDKKTLVTIPLGKRRLLRNWGVFSPASRRLSLPETIFIEILRTISATLPGTIPPRESRKARLVEPRLAPLAAAGLAETRLLPASILWGCLAHSLVL